MAFVVKKINLDDLDNQTGKFEYGEGDGKLSITLKSFSNPQFQKAYSMLTTKQHADAEAIKGRKLNDDFLSDIDADDKTVDELLVKAIGMFLVADWDAVDQNGDKLEVTPHNFMLLLANIDDKSGFVEWCLGKAADVAKTKTEAIAEAKKKPSVATSGKKITRA